MIFFTFLPFTSRYHLIKHNILLVGHVILIYPLTSTDLVIPGQYHSLIKILLEHIVKPVIQSSTRKYSRILFSQFSHNCCHPLSFIVCLWPIGRPMCDSKLESLRDRNIILLCTTMIWFYFLLMVICIIIILIIIIIVLNISIC